MQPGGREGLLQPVASTSGFTTSIKGSYFRPIGVSPGTSLNVTERP